MNDNMNPQQPQGAPTQPPANQPQSAPAAYQAAYTADIPTQQVPPAHAAAHQTQVQSGTTAQHNPYASAPATAAPAAQSAAAATQKKNSGAKTFLFGFLGALVACVLAFGIMAATNMFGMRGGTTLGAAPSDSIEAASEEASLAEAVASKCMASVGSVAVYSNQASQQNGIYEFLYGYGYGEDRSDSLTQSGTGSCVMLSEDGYAITNYHVVSGGSKFEVTIEGETYDAELVGDDASSDVAVLKIDSDETFTPIELGDSDNLSVGEWVMSIGSPFGLEQSVATGIVSATSRSQIMDASTDMLGNSTGEATIYPNMIQTDAAINPGNSGGALVDAQGRLIGINTLITSYSGNYSGVGFAIPVNYAINLAQDIIDGREPTHAQLGVNLTTVNKQIAQRYGFSVDEGAYISAVVPDSGAAQAGIEVGDIITRFDGMDVASASDLMLDVRTKNPGDTVSVTFVRDGEEQEVQVTLGSDENSKSSSQSNKGNQLIPQGNGGKSNTL